MNITDSLLVQFHDPSQFDFELYITACKEWLQFGKTFTKPKNGVSYCYFPDVIATSRSTGDVLNFLFGEDMDFSGEGKAVPYLLTRLCAQALDPKIIDIRYLPEKCSTLNDKNGISINLSQGNMTCSGYHNILLVIEHLDKWSICIDGCWGGRDDGVGPTYYPEEYKYQGELRGVKNSITSFSSSGYTPFGAFMLWNVDIVRLQTSKQK